MPVASIVALDYRGSRSSPRPCLSNSFGWASWARNPAGWLYRQRFYRQQLASRRRRLRPVRRSRGLRGIGAAPLSQAIPARLRAGVRGPRLGAGLQGRSVPPASPWQRGAIRPGYADQCFALSKPLARCLLRRLADLRRCSAGQPGRSPIVQAGLRGGCCRRSIGLPADPAATPGAHLAHLAGSMPVASRRVASFRPSSAPCPSPS